MNRIEIIINRLIKRFVDKGGENNLERAFSIYTAYRNQINLSWTQFPEFNK